MKLGLSRGDRDRGDASLPWIIANSLYRVKRTGIFFRFIATFVMSLADLSLARRMTVDERWKKRGDKETDGEDKRGGEGAIDQRKSETERFKTATLMRRLERNCINEIKQKRKRG